MKTAAIILGVLPVAALASAASSAIIYSGERNIVTPLPPAPVPPVSATTRQSDVDFDSNGSNDMLVYYERQSSATSALLARPDTTLALIPLAETTVSSSLTFMSGINYTGPGVQPGTSFFAFRLVLPDGPHFGWVRTEYQPNFDVVVRDWAFESIPEATIQKGQIPAPAAAAVGLIALLAAPRRRPV